MGDKTVEKNTPMVFSNGNIWLGTEESLENVYQLNRFLADPLSFSEKSARLGVFDDEEESEGPYQGIGSHLIQVEGNLGIIHVNGSMTNRYSYWNRHFRVVSYPEVRDALASLANDPEIKDTLIVINTNGGAAQGCPELAEFISAVDKTVKPVYCHTSEICFSAGMWLASSGRRLTANKIAEQGSVGVVVTLVSYHKLYEKAGVETKTIRGGKFKALGQPTEPLTEEVIATIEAKVDRLYGYFLEAVSAGRPALSVAAKDTWAEGKTFFSEDSVKIGLIDEIVTFDNLVAKFLTSYDNVSVNYGLSAGGQNQEELTMGNKTEAKKILTPELAAAAASGAPLDEAGLQTEPVVEPEQEGGEAGTVGADAGSEGEVQPEAQEGGNGASAGGDLQERFINQSVELKYALKELDAAKASLADLKAESTALKAVVIEAINNREIALNRSPTSPTVLEAMGHESLMSLNAELKTKFSEKYAIGGKAAVASELRDSSAELSTGFMPILPKE